MAIEASNQNPMRVVNVYCVECCKEFESNIGDHSKNIIHNLFAYWKKKLPHV